MVCRVLNIRLHHFYTDSYKRGVVGKGQIMHSMQDADRPGILSHENVGDRGSYLWQLLL